MSGFTKLFASITDSTIWRAPDTTRLVWITMLAMADQNGYVAASVPGLADRARVSLDACIAALESFQQPDEWSRTKDYEGRRIAECDGGWLLLNHAKYRAERAADERRDYMRNLMAERRAAAKQAKPLAPVSNVSRCKPPLAQAEAYTEEKNQEQKSMPPLASKPDARGTRLPDDWQPSQELIDYARAKRPTMNIANEVEAFRDYWHAKAGAGARKVDWSLTFKTWIRSAYNKPPTQTVQQLGGSRAAGRML
ncbi:MAG: DnaT-like ssDNA-binding domain-containing protein [Nitrospiraceae bacterium]